VYHLYGKNSVEREHRPDFFAVTGKNTVKLRDFATIVHKMFSNSVKILLQIGKMYVIIDDVK
jgi:hypothetical protein